MKKNKRKNFRHTDESKKKISESLKGKFAGQKHPMHGKHHTEESKKKISQANMGRVTTDETRKKLSDSKKGKPRPDLLGKKHTDESRKKMSEAKKGKIFSEEHRQNLSKAMLGRPSPRKGMKLSQDQKKRQSESMLGKPSWNKGKKTPSAVKKKISDSRIKGIKEGKIISSRKGKTHSLEANEKNRLAHIGKKMSDEAKLKMSIAQNRPETLQKNRERRSKQVFPAKDTAPEVTVQKILKDNGISFQKHVSIKLSKSYHQADLIVESNKVIEIFGDYWHFNPKQYDGDSIHKVRGKKIKVKEVWEYDQYVIDGMKQQNLHVLVIWESELKKEFEKTVEKILKFLQ